MRDHSLKRLITALIAMMLVSVHAPNSSLAGPHGKLALHREVIGQRDYYRIDPRLVPPIQIDARIGLEEAAKPNSVAEEFWRQQKLQSPTVKLAGGIPAMIGRGVSRFIRSLGGSGVLDEVQNAKRLEILRILSKEEPEAADVLAHHWATTNELRKKAIPQTQIQTQRELRELNEAGSFVRIKDALKPELVKIGRDSVTGKFERIIPSDSEDISQLNQARVEARDAAIDLMSSVLTKIESSGKRVERSDFNYPPHFISPYIFPYFLMSPGKRVERSDFNYPPQHIFPYFLMSPVLTKTELSGKRVERSDFNYSLQQELGNPNRGSTAENLGLVSTMKATSRNIKEGKLTEDQSNMTIKLDSEYFKDRSARISVKTVFNRLRLLETPTQNK
jgi:hypothetical protein